MLQTQLPEMEIPVVEPEQAPAEPRMVALGDVQAPRAPVEVRDTGVDEAVLVDLTLKAAHTVPRFTTEWVSRRLGLPQLMVGGFLEQLRSNHLLDVLGQTGPFGYRYAITQSGRERARRLLEISGYVGPAPVSLAAYAAMLDWQLARIPRITPAQVAEALADLVLPDEVTQVAGLAASAGRSLFLFGPPGNGKTSLGHLLHHAIVGALWIPFCLSVDSQVIQLFDPQVHRAAPVPLPERGVAIDQRWIRIHRPLIISGGEMTLDALDLRFSDALGYYEAPIPLKANGGTLLVDDFGRQRVDPFQMLNRWIIPLESQIDYLTLQTGQKIQVPFRLMLMIATNLKLERVTDAAFLRRMGYRIFLDKPSPERYAQIFAQYAARCNLEFAPSLLAGLLSRYGAEQRELRCCEPRDLIERCRDLCRFRGQPAQLTEEIMGLAWAGYFGQESGYFPSQNDMLVRPGSA